MRNTLYRQMVYCINAYRTWIEVADDNLYKEHIISRTDRTDYLVSRTLVLRAFKTNGIHAEGTTWTIPEHELGQGFGHLPKARHYIQAAHQESGHVLFAQGCRNPYPAGDIRYCPVGTHCASHSHTRKALLLMLLNILLLIFCAIPFGVSMSLYKNNKRFMTPFYMAMARSGNARKLYVQVWLICLLLFHYVYACGHMGEFGILLSTGVCAAMFSFRRTDNWLRRLLDRPRAFVTLASGALVIGFVPHLYTLAITIAYLLLAALFYPSVRVMSECKDTDTLSGWAKHPGMLSESYHENHHANLPHEADSGNTDISAQYESLKPNENEK